MSLTRKWTRFAPYRRQTACNPGGQSFAAKDWILHACSHRETAQHRGSLHKLRRSIPNEPPLLLKMWSPSSTNRRVIHLIHCVRSQIQRSHSPGEQNSLLTVSNPCVGSQSLKEMTQAVHNFAETCARRSSRSHIQTILLQADLLQKERVWSLCPRMTSKILPILFSRSPAMRVRSQVERNCAKTTNFPSMYSPIERQTMPCETCQTEKTVNLCVKNFG